jgi:hypothetical protein
MMLPGLDFSSFYRDSEKKTMLHQGKISTPSLGELSRVEIQAREDIKGSSG